MSWEESISIEEVTKEIVKARGVLLRVSDKLLKSELFHLALPIHETIKDMDKKIKYLNDKAARRVK